MPSQGTLSALFLRAPLLREKSFLTDDTVLTVAIANVIREGLDLATSLRAWGRRYPNAGYGGWFYRAECPWGEVKPGPSPKPRPSGGPLGARSAPCDLPADKWFGDSREDEAADIRKLKALA